MFTKIGVGELCDFEKTKRLMKVNGPVDFGITGGGGSTTDRVKSVLRESTKCVTCMVPADQRLWQILCWRFMGNRSLRETLMHQS